MSIPLGYDYPAGAANDPRAPWNQESDEACEYCGGTGKIHRVTDGDIVGVDELEVFECRHCDGTGEQHQPTRDEIECDKADRARDNDKDRESDERQ